MELLFQSAINLNRLSSSDKAYHILKVIRNLNEENIWYCMVNLMIIMIVSSILRWLRFSATVIYITVFIGVSTNHSVAFKFIILLIERLATTYMFELVYFFGLELHRHI